MKCPYCQEEMQLGYIPNGGTALCNGFRTEKGHRFSLFQLQNREFPNQSVQTVKIEWI